MSPNDAHPADKSKLELTFNGQKVQDSPWHRDNVLGENKTSVHIVQNLDGIEKMQVPLNWFKVDQQSSLGKSTSFRPSTTDTTKISLFADRKPVSEQAQKSFEQVVNADLPTPRLLFSQAAPDHFKDNIETIKNLSTVFGSTTVGDNQLTAPPTYRPSFHLDTLKVENLNGKNVIVVDGWFMQLNNRGDVKEDANGPVKSRYQGVIFGFKINDDNNLKVRKLSLQSDDELSFSSNKSVFRKALQSIVWK